MYNLNIKKEKDKELYQDILKKIYQERKNRLVITMLTVFGDESHDEKKQRVYVVAGIAGIQQEWDDLEPKWIKRTGGVPFHSSDCEADQGDYKTNTHDENLKLYADMVNIILNSSLMGFASIVDLVAFNEFFPDIIDHMPYFFSFSKVIDYFDCLRPLYFPPEKKVEFIFDRNLQTQGAAVLMYDYITQLEEYKYRTNYLDTVTFAKRDERIGIQVVDVVAREAMKNFDNYLMGSKKIARQPVKILSSSGRFLFDIFGRDYWESLKKQIDSLEEKSGVNGEDYHSWLTRNKIQGDNASTRLRYLLQLPKPIGEIIPK